MNLLSYLVAIGHHSHIACYYGRDAGFLGGIHNLVHQRDVFVIDDCVHREVCLYAVFIASGGNLPQVVNGECACRMCSHVQLFDAEVYRVCTSLNGSGKTFP